MKLSELKSAEQVLAEQLKDPTLTTLIQLSRRLGLEFHIDITPSSLQLTA